MFKKINKKSFPAISPLGAVRCDQPACNEGRPAAADSLLLRGFPNPASFLPPHLPLPAGSFSSRSELKAGAAGYAPPSPTARRHLRPPPLAGLPAPVSGSLQFFGKGGGI